MVIRLRVSAGTQAGSQTPTQPALTRRGLFTDEHERHVETAVQARSNAFNHADRCRRACRWTTRVGGHWFP